MKSLSNVIVLFFSLFILASCGSKNEKTPSGNSQMPNSQMAQTYQVNNLPTDNRSSSENNFKSVKKEKLVLKYLKDTTGVQVARMPLPESWKINPNHKDTLKMRAPGGITVSQKPGINFAYTENETNKKKLEAEGFLIEPVRSLEDIVKYIAPKFNSIGYSFVKTFTVPTYEKIVQKELSKIIIPGGKMLSSALAVEFKSTNNKRMVLVLLQSKTRVENIDFWCLDMSKLIAPEDVFEYAKKTYLFALDNIQINPKVITDANQGIQGGTQENTNN